MPTEIERDRYGRPLVVPPKGGKAIAYTRATTISNSLETSTPLSSSSNMIGGSRRKRRHNKHKKTSKKIHKRSRRYHKKRSHKRRR